MISDTMKKLNEQKLELTKKLNEITRQIDEQMEKEAELMKSARKIEEKIEAQVMKIWTRSTYPYSPDSVSAKITKFGGEVAVEIDISREYQSPEIKFSDLVALSQYFDGTERIGEVNDWSHPGCDTCDYGSSYGFTIRVLPKVEGGSIVITSEGIEIK